MGAADHHIDVQLGLALHGVEVVAALSLFHVHVHSRGSIGGGGHVVAAHLAGQVVNLVLQVALSHAELVGGAGLQFFSQGNVRNGGLFAFTFTFAAGGGMGHDPAVLHLGSAAVLADDAVQGDGIAGNGLGGQAIITDGTVGRPGAVDGDGCIAVGDVHIAVGAVVDLSDGAGDVVLAGGVGIMLFLLTNGNGLGNGQGGIGGGIGRFVGRILMEHGNELTAGTEFDGAVVVGQHTVDFDDVVHIQLVKAAALHAVALNEIAVGIHGNGDVAIVGIVGVVNGGDSAGEVAAVGQGLAGLQRKGSFQNLVGILGSHRCFAAAGDHSLQNAALGKFDLALVIGQGAGNGDGITNSQLVCTLALQAVALDGHVLGTGNFDGDGDVLVAGIVHGVNGDNDTGEGMGALQGLTGLQCVSSLDHINGILVDGCGNHMIPGEGDLTAVGANEGSSQHVGNGLSQVSNCLFVDVDGKGTVFVLNDFDEIFVHIHRPDNVVLGGADTNLAQPVIVHGGLLSSVLVEHPQIFQGLFQLRISLGSGFRRFRAGIGFLSGLGFSALEQVAAGEHAQADG